MTSFNVPLMQLFGSPKSVIVRRPTRLSLSIPLTKFLNLLSPRRFLYLLDYRPSHSIVYICHFWHPLFCSLLFLFQTPMLIVVLLGSNDFQDHYIYIQYLILFRSSQ